jgi:RNA polymerase sigma-70 factor (ECF subfamily)
MGELSGPGEAPHEQVTDLELVARAKRNDPAAAEQIIRRYHAKAYAIAYRTCSGDEEEAKDLTQEAFLRVFRNLKTFEGRASFYTWLYQIVVNTCLDAMRRRQRRKRIFPFWRSGNEGGEGSGEVPEEHPDSDRDSDPLVTLSGNELRLQVQKALGTLSDHQRMVFELKVFEEMSIPEIAKMTNSAEGTVKSHLFRATQHVRKVLSDWVEE